MRPRSKAPSLVVAVCIGIALAAFVAGCSQAPTSSTTPSTPPTSGATSPTSAPATPSAPSTPQVTGVALGQMIFDTGADNSGPIPTKFGIASVKVNACKNCHGPNGKGGKPLPGPNIQGSTLQPDYDEAKFARAVTTGIDDTGKPLESKMPRFSATPDDTNALWLYVNTLK